MSLTPQTVPDIGDYSQIPVIDIAVKPGDRVAVDDTLITLESDKATMDVPATAAGVVRSIKLKLGDKVSQGDVILELETSAEGAPAAAPVAEAAPAPAAVVTAPAPAPVSAPTPASIPSPAVPAASSGGRLPHASPAVRMLARELGVDLAKVRASGPKERILKQDIRDFVKQALTAPPVASSAASSAGLNLLPWPQVNFDKFGPVEKVPLSRIKKLSGANLARNWVMIPAVTYHEEADITELEQLRVKLNQENDKTGPKLTMLAFVIKACVKALQLYPELNASLEEDHWVKKNFWHIGFAADTPNGLVVPVVKNADTKGVYELALETGQLAKRAREGKLSPTEMQGASFTISSLGGIGGTAFSPIVNAPEVAILGLSKSSFKPLWNGQSFESRLMLPLSLSADHRLIDGALATRFNTYVAQLLADFRRITL